MVSQIQIRTSLRRLAPPLIGAAVGFALFGFFLSYGQFVIALPDKAVEQIGLIAATFVAAWAGGWAAFSAERNTRSEAERKARISAANKALFVIATMYNVFENLCRFYIDKGNLRNNPNRALMMDSPQPGMMEKLHFDFDELSYFLDAEGDVSSMALMELQVLDWHFQMLINTIELRAMAAEDLHKAIRAQPISNLTADSVPALYQMEYKKSLALTDQLIEFVDAGIKLTKEMNEKMKVALQQQFPGQGFLQINFAEKADSPKPSS